MSFRDVIDTPTVDAICDLLEKREASPRVGTLATLWVFCLSCKMERIPREKVDSLVAKMLDLVYSVDTEIH